MKDIALNKKPYITLENAKSIILDCHEFAKVKGFPPVAVAVCDDGGHLIALERSADVPPISAKIAINKARTAAMGRRNSSIYEEQINKGRQALLSAPDVEALMTGGVPVVLENFCIGAVGVSNLKPHEDEEVAKAGLESLLSNFSG